MGLCVGRVILDVYYYDECILLSGQISGYVYLRYNSFVASYYWNHVCESVQVYLVLGSFYV
jgi:hypothetical protein